MSNSVCKLESNTVYVIISYNAIDTQYGKCYILKDSNFNEYFSTKKINDWIKKNPNKTSFKIKTGSYKEFTSNGDTIKFLDLYIHN